MPPSRLQAAPSPPASYARPGAVGCQVRQWTSRAASGRWSLNDAPASSVRITPPSSMPTSTTPASCGLGAIQRTCEVHGRGGKLQVGFDGISWSATSSSHVSPRSWLRKSRLGSVPAYTAPSTGLTATLKTSCSGTATSSKVSPPSALRLSPPPRQPTWTSSPPIARHWAPDPSRRVPAPTRTKASPVVASSSIWSAHPAVAPYRERHEHEKHAADPRQRSRQRVRRSGQRERARCVRRQRHRGDPGDRLEPVGERRDRHEDRAREHERERHDEAGRLRRLGAAHSECDVGEDPTERQAKDGDNRNAADRA